MEFFDIGFKKVNESEWWEADINPDGCSNMNSSYGVPPIVDSDWIRGQRTMSISCPSGERARFWKLSHISCSHLEPQIWSPHLRLIIIISGWAEDYALIKSSISKLGLPITLQ